MKKLKWNRFCTIFVLLMFITVTYASFNTNLFINGKGYVRVEEGIRITNIKLLSNENNGYETYESEFSKNTVTMDVNLPKQNSTISYQVTIQNTFPYDYDVKEILEENYSNKNVKYELVGVAQNTLIEKNSTKTFTIKFSNNATITQEDDVYETKEYTFDYTGGEQVFTVPYDGEYTLEVWGASGGGYSTEYIGYGGYSKGTISLKKNKKLYIYVGGAGTTEIEDSTAEASFVRGGWNGGGSGYISKSFMDYKIGSGGGSTDIRTIKAPVTLQNNSYYTNDKQSLDSRIIVAGGGGGAGHNTSYPSGGGSAGGIKGNSVTSSWNDSHQHPIGGTQTTGTFGYGKTPITTNTSTHLDEGNNLKFCSGGAGGGWYGGEASIYQNCRNFGGAGGSGYIANPNLKDKVMYCYNCEESEETETKTISTENHSSDPISNNAKEGNGYAKITITRKISDGAEFNFDYTGGEQTFSAPYSGIYKLETWGAQGGFAYAAKTFPGGYGGYSTGTISLGKNQNLYINVGGQGVNCKNNNSCSGGYNGGGNVTELYSDTVYGGTGGGATHISTISGLLSSLENYKNKILIVSGGGGGSGKYLKDSSKLSVGSSGMGGHAGGYKGSKGSPYNDSYSGVGTGGTQTTAGYCTGSDNLALGSFGKGGDNTKSPSNDTDIYGGAGGGGFYGGGGTCSNHTLGGGGGSSYIGNTLLSNKVMYCYNCAESSEEQTKTITTLAHSELPKQNQAKEGNGYSRITLLKRKVNNTKLTLKFEFDRHLYDYTITYDENYLKNDMMYDLYNTFGYSRCCPGPSDNSQFPISGVINEEGSTVTANKKATCTQEALGYYFGFKNNIDLEVGEVYEFSFEVKGNKNFVANIGPEAGGRINYNVTTEWKKHSRIFTASDYKWRAFTMYSWGAIGDDRTLWIRNYQINKHEEKNYLQYESTETKPLGTNVAPNPNREGWKFTGWYDDPIEGNQINENTVTPSTNTTYYAHWKQVKYNVAYDLDGGNVTSQLKSYYYLDNNKSLPTPTKEGYTFAGWTGGKSIFSYDYIDNNQHLGEGTTTSTNGLRGLFDVKPNTYYTLSTNLPPRPDGGMYVIMKASDDFNEPLTSSRDGASSDKTITVKSTENGHIIIAFFRSMMNSEMASKLDTGEYWFQIEEGEQATAYESYISEPTTSVTIPYYSSGNRTYKANWVKNYDIEYDLDGGNITDQPTTYNELTDTFTLPTPTKEGYTFAGWTGGKNLLDMSAAKGGYISGMQCILNGDGTYRLKGNIEAEVESSPVNVWFLGKWDDSADTLFTLSPGTYYIRDVSLFKNKGDINGGNGIFTFSNAVDVTGVRAPYVGTNKDYDEIRYPMIASADKKTSFEPYISTPQTTITIPKGSEGNRIYTANWVAN